MLDQFHVGRFQQPVLRFFIRFDLGFETGDQILDFDSGFLGFGFPNARETKRRPLTVGEIVLQQADVFVQETRLIGHPMGSVQTTEQTGKKWKALMLIGAFVAFLSACVFGLGIAANDGGHIGSYSLVGMLLGIGIFIHAKVGAWWNHG